MPSMFFRRFSCLRLPLTLLPRSSARNSTSSFSLLGQIRQLSGSNSFAFCSDHQRNGEEQSRIDSSKHQRKAANSKQESQESPIAKSQGQQESQQQKQQQPKKNERIKYVILEKDIEWSFVKGSGPGGQSVNKTSNCAVATHTPSGVTVRSHASRDLETNKHYCRKQLSEKLDEIINGSNSKSAQKQQKKDKQQARRRRKSDQKYGKDVQAGETVVVVAATTTAREPIKSSPKNND